MSAGRNISERRSDDDCGFTDEETGEVSLEEMDQVSSEELEVARETRVVEV